VVIAASVLFSVIGDGGTRREHHLVSLARTHRLAAAARRG
jgi:hypothetical protein